MVTYHVTLMSESCYSVNNYNYSRTLIIRTSIIRISRLSGRFLWSQFCHEYLLVIIKIPSHILFKTTALKSKVNASLFLFHGKKQNKAALAHVLTNAELLNEF